MALGDQRRSSRWKDGEAPVGLAIGALAATASLLVWAAAIEPRLLEETEVYVRLPGLPSAWNGKRIAALGDFQIGVWWANTGTSRRAVRRAIEARPAAILLLGDYLYHAAPNRREAISTVENLLAPLVGAGIPTYAVLGNHDYGLDDGETLPPEDLARSVRQALTGLGVSVLQNEAVELPLPSGRLAGQEVPLSLVALGSHNAKEQEVAAALSAVPDGRPRIVMMHNPHSFRALPPGSAPFAVAGHTHGAQVRIPFLPGRSWLARHERAPAYAAGWTAPEFGQPGNRLYVNRGIGFSGLPLRLGARPELTFFHLVRH